MRILVTGGAGFIGSAFVRMMVGETGWSVTNFDKLTYAGNLENLAPIEQSAQLPLRPGRYLRRGGRGSRRQRMEARRDCAFRGRIARGPQHSVAGAGDPDQFPRHVHAARGGPPVRRVAPPGPDLCTSRRTKSTAAWSRPSKPGKPRRSTRAALTRRPRREVGPAGTLLLRDL